MKCLSYDLIVNGYEIESEEPEDIEAEIIQILNGVVWMDIEQTENNIKYSRFVVRQNGVEAYYDYGADYYFFRSSGGINNDTLNKPNG